MTAYRANIGKDYRYWGRIDRGGKFRNQNDPINLSITFQIKPEEYQTTSPFRVTQLGDLALNLTRFLG
jgi:hypothetical protein